MFLIGGVQPKIRTLDQHPQRCSRCGLQEVYWQRLDHYLSLFLIPLFPVKKGEPYLFCRQCRQPAGPYGGADRRVSSTSCRQCGGELKSDYTYCPFCGLPR
jgi:hypothetical protein